MKVVEIMKLGKNFLELLQKSCVRVDDLQFVDLYDEYVAMTEGGEKSTYAVSLLSERYSISERQVYYLVKKLGADCKIGAV